MYILKSQEGAFDSPTLHNTLARHPSPIHPTGYPHLYLRPKS